MTDAVDPDPTPTHQNQNAEKNHRRGVSFDDAVGSEGEYTVDPAIPLELCLPNLNPWGTVTYLLFFFAFLLSLQKLWVKVDMQAGVIVTMTS